MAEKTLAYDKSIVPQETGWWCGPASAQVVLNARGIRVAEAALATEIGTTWNGTDFIQLIENVLDVRVPDAEYTSVDLRRDPPTTSQQRTLFDHIRSSIGAGWGVIANIVAPPSNYPRSVPPSTIHLAYSGGTVFHYLSIMGWACDGEIPANLGSMSDAEFLAWAKRVNLRVWLADSGFSPYGAWISFLQLCTLIPPKAYCYAAGLSTPPRIGADEVLTRRYASRSKYRDTDEQVGTLADFVLWIDGRVHERYSERVTL